MEKNLDIEINSLTSAQDTMISVRESIFKVLDPLEEGEKTTIKDLIDKVVAEKNIKVSIANGLVPMVVHELAAEGICAVEKGRGGGVFKGRKPLRVDPRPRCPTCGQVDRKKLSASHKDS